jgi:chemotaxis protein MotB
MAKKKGHDEEERVNHERWLVSYADFITLLMVLFVVLYSMSRADDSKFAKLSASLKRAFNVEVLRGDDPTTVHGDYGADAPVGMIREAIAQRDASSTDNLLVTTLDELRQAIAELPQTERSRQGVEVAPARDGIVISLSGNVLFDSGRADLRLEGLDLLDALAARLSDMPNEIRVEGHTDNVPIATPLYPSNWELSSARATTVARYLSEHGVAPVRLMAAGFGDNRPVAPNDTREGRARNRRVDIVIVAAPLSANPAGAPRAAPPSILSTDLFSPTTTPAANGR